MVKMEQLLQASINGLAVIRVDMTQSDSCEELPNTVCLDSTITNTKNTLFTEVGDTAKFVFEMPHKQKITILSGELATLELEIDLEKMRVKEVTKIVEEEVQEVQRKNQMNFKKKLGLNYKML